LLTLSASTPARAADSCWLLEQESIVGKYSIWIAPNAVRATDRAHGCSFLCKAPDWTVTIFRDSEKIKMEIPLKEWRRRGNKWYFNNFSPADASTVSWVPTQFAGLKGSKYFREDKRTVKGHEEFGVLKIGSYSVLGEEYIMTDQIPSAPEISQFMQGLLCCVYVRGIPLTDRQIFADHTTKPRFITVKATKVPQEANLFAVPKYKTGNEQTILVGTANEEDLKDMLGGLDLGSHGFGRSDDKSKSK
jgi:hypothetical protein